jgi:hypothetical protein
VQDSTNNRVVLRDGSQGWAMVGSTGERTQTVKGRIHPCIASKEDPPCIFYSIFPSGIEEEHSLRG